MTKARTSSSGQFLVFAFFDTGLPVWAPVYGTHHDIVHLFGVMRERRKGAEQILIIVLLLVLNLEYV